jgi:hypothetical protein
MERMFIQQQKSDNEQLTAFVQQKISKVEQYSLFSGHEKGKL